MCRRERERQRERESERWGDLNRHWYVGERERRREQMLICAGERETERDRERERERRREHMLICAGERDRGRERERVRGG